MTKVKSLEATQKIFRDLVFHSLSFIGVIALFLGAQGMADPVVLPLNGVLLEIEEDQYPITWNNIGSQGASAGFSFYEYQGRFKYRTGSGSQPIHGMMKYVGNNVPHFKMTGGVAYGAHRTIEIGRGNWANNKKYLLTVQQQVEIYHDGTNYNQLQAFIYCIKKSNNQRMHSWHSTSVRVVGGASTNLKTVSLVQEIPANICRGNNYRMDLYFQAFGAGIKYKPLRMGVLEMGTPIN